MIGVIIVDHNTGGTCEILGDGVFFVLDGELVSGQVQSVGFCGLRCGG